MCVSSPPSLQYKVSPLFALAVDLPRRNQEFKIRPSLRRKRSHCCWQIFLLAASLPIPQLLTDHIIKGLVSFYREGGGLFIRAILMVGGTFLDDAKFPDARKESPCVILRQLTKHEGGEKNPPPSSSIFPWNFSPKFAQQTRASLTQRQQGAIFSPGSRGLW